MIDDYNENLNLFRTVIDEKLNATILVDNYAVLSQLMDQHFTYNFQLPNKQHTEDNIGVDIAIICHSAKRYNPKTLWLSHICESVIKDAIK
ncbi:hypothetical protein [Shewanella subflava]|uniref:Uncharacterized protein n=1 Tax=Shewanella subflava TaxID=2986476 RepID=A0ABT3I7J1_9GAMM|nr:hypothetical protein [Shewanella subflava]MCW3171935.1 hypothetical protein [Shewanella subflava]